MANNGPVSKVTDNEITGEVSDKDSSGKSSPAGPPTPGSRASLAQPARLGDCRVLRAFARYGWEPETSDDLPSRFRTDSIFPLPSPLAENSLWTPEWTQIASRIIPQWEPQLRELWNQFRDRRRALTRNLPSDPTSPFLGVLQKRSSAAISKKEKERENSNGDTNEPRLINCETKNGMFELDLRRIDVSSSGPGSNGGEELTGKSLQIRRMFHSESGAEGFFFVNSDIRNVRIYGREHIPPIPPVIFGPLPSFAIISIGPNLPIFWWRNLKGTDFVPDPEAVAAESKKRKENNKDPFNSDEDEFPKYKRRHTEKEFRQHVLEVVKRVLPSRRERSTTWRSRLKARLDRHRNRKLRIVEEKKDFMQLKSLEKLMQDHIILAIASVWAALRRKNIRFALGHYSVYAPPDTDLEVEPDQDVVAGERGFIMPIFFPGKDLHDVGHHVLAIGHLLGDGDRQQIQVNIYDSAANHVAQRDLDDQLSSIITESEWFKRPNRTRGEQIDPAVWQDDKHIPVPHQASRLSCGFSVIINAWAVMLGIPIHESWGARRKVDGLYSNGTFLAQGLEIVNLALAGCVDSTTIRMFLDAHGYSAEPRANVTNHTSQRITTVRMTNERFVDILRSENRLERWRERGSPVTEEMRIQIAQIVGMIGHESEQPIAEALVVEEHNIERAVSRLMDNMESPQTPSPSTTDISESVQSVKD